MVCQLSRRKNRSRGLKIAVQPVVTSMVCQLKWKKELLEGAKDCSASCILTKCMVCQLNGRKNCSRRLKITAKFDLKINFVATCIALPSIWYTN